MTSLRKTCARMAPLAPLAIAIAMLGCTTTPAPRSTLPTGPAAGDRVLSPFYDWREALPAQPGVMLRTEPAAAQPEITAAGLAQRILYTSQDARWNAGVLPVSGTLYLPRGDAPAGGWPVMAWAHGTLGVADVCAPSWALHRPRDATYINRWLEQGFAVVATDYQGLGGPGPHAYLVWESEGRSILDSVRAALAAHPGRLANQVVVTGQSQGSGAALGARQIAARYAPELKLRATIATGVASTFPDGPYRVPPPATSPTGPSRFTMLRLVGGSLPDGVAPESLVTDKAQRLLALAREACVDEMRGHEQQNGLHMAAAFRDPERLVAQLRPVTDMPMHRQAAPLFLGTGLADRTVTPRHQYGAAAALCAAGNTVVWKTYAGITHNGIVNAAFDDELNFVRQVMAGQAVAPDCGRIAEPGLPGTPTAGIRFND